MQQRRNKVDSDYELPQTINDPEKGKTKYFTLTRLVIVSIVLFVIFHDSLLSPAHDPLFHGTSTDNNSKTTAVASIPSSSKRTYNTEAERLALINKVWVDEEENPFDKDWEQFPAYEVADHCGVSDLFYWNNAEFTETPNPHNAWGGKDRYITFEPDHGGWNNIRMAMETILVFAYVTGRTLVLPPKQGLYLLNAIKDKKHGFEDFFYLHRVAEQVKIIEMEEYLTTQGLGGKLRDRNGTVTYPQGASHRNNTHIERKELWTYLRKTGFYKKWDTMRSCLVFPLKPGMKLEDHDPATVERLETGCSKRTPIYYDQDLMDARVIHFPCDPANGFRLLTHFYVFVQFADPKLDRHIKRFVRDYIHYRDEVFCAAGRIIAAMELASKDNNYTSYHIRRGDLQYKEVKIPPEEIIENTRDVTDENMIVYIATDEKDPDFLIPFKKRFKEVYTLNYFFDKVGLKHLDPNYIGMIETIVCARSGLFFGTWFSTFSGYITRMRGYYGHHYTTNWYHYLLRKNSFQIENVPRSPYYMREWPTGWWQIDEAT